MNENNDPIPNKDATLYVQIPHPANTYGMTQFPCSDFPCYDSLYLQQSSSTVKTDENGVARWDMLSTDSGNRIVYVKIGDVEINNNGNPPVITYYKDDTMSSLGYKINDSADDVIEIARNSVLTHSWDIQPVSVQSTIEEYMKSIGYNVSDFFTIQRLDISKPAGERQWEVAFSPESLSGKFEEQITHNTRYRAIIKIPAKLEGTDESKRLEGCTKYNSKPNKRTSFYKSRPKLTRHSL